MLGQDSTVLNIATTVGVENLQGA